MLGRDFEDEVWSRFVFELVIRPNRLLWKDELNPWVRCAFGNVIFILVEGMEVCPENQLVYFGCNIWYIYWSWRLVFGQFCGFNAHPSLHSAGLIKWGQRFNWILDLINFILFNLTFILFVIFIFKIVSIMQKIKLHIILFIVLDKLS